MAKKKNIFKELHQLKREEKEIHEKEVRNCWRNIP